MTFIRNWILPLFVFFALALIGLILMTLPGVEMIQTLDGVSYSEGLSREQMEMAISGKARVGSYLDFYGVRLPGTPLYWTLGVPFVMGLVGYRLTYKKFKVKRKP